MLHNRTNPRVNVRCIKFCEPSVLLINNTTTNAFTLLKFVNHQLWSPQKSVIVRTYRCCDINTNLFHLRFVQDRDCFCHVIVMTSLTTKWCDPCRFGTFSVIVYLMCSNEIVKDHCSNNDQVLSAYLKGWHMSQNFPFILPNSKSSFYDRTEWWMEIIKSLLWTMQHFRRPKFSNVLPLPLIWCKEPFPHRVS